MFGNTTNNKSNIYERNWSKFDRKNFSLDYFSIDWDDLLKEMLIILLKCIQKISLFC